MMHIFKETAYLAIKFDGFRRHIHIQMPTENFVCAIPGKNNLGLSVFSNKLSEQVVGNTGAHSEGIVSFDGMNHFGNRLNEILLFQNKFVVHTTEMIGYHFSVFQIFTTFHANTERFEISQSVGHMKLFDETSNNATVQSPRQQTTHRQIGRSTALFY